MKEKKKEQQKTVKKVKNLVATRGRIFEGVVTRKFPGRVSIEFERTIRVPKYGRFFKKKTRIHAKLPTNIEANIGDLIKVQECRPLSKTIHFLVIEKIKSKDEENGGEE